MNPKLVAAVVALMQLVPPSVSQMSGTSPFNHGSDRIGNGNAAREGRSRTSAETHSSSSGSLSSSAAVVPGTPDWVRKEPAIDSLLNIDTISFDHSEAGHLIPADLLIAASADTIQRGDLFSHRLNGKTKFQSSADRMPESSATRGGDGASSETGEDLGAETAVDSTTDSALSGEPSANIVSSSEASIAIMNRTFSEIFSRPRSDDHNQQLKDTARNAILSRIRDLQIEAFTQSFTANRRGDYQKGINLIGVLPGRNRDVPGKDQIIVVGAHYDTVSTSPGIDDNASGMILLLELARILKGQSQLNHTVMFVGFDLEELGLLGSIAFVREYLIPTELLAKRSTFLGAYVIDMALSYDPTPGSQTIPSDIMMACPGVTSKIAQDGNRGDFMAVWMRDGVDGEVYRSLVEEWRGSPKFKLRTFDPLLPPSTPSTPELYRFRTFTRSDHASFWYHKHPNFKQTLNAVLLTDMGPWRGSVGAKCYHNWCDDAAQLTERNLKFLKNTIDSLARVLLMNPPAAPSSPIDETPLGSSVPPVVSRGSGGDRGSRTNRGRGRGPPTRRTAMPNWPSFPSAFPSTFGSYPAFRMSDQQRGL